MRLALTITLLLPLAAFALPVSAETEGVCLARWKAADLDANGALEADKDDAAYARLAGAGAPVGRDEFLKRCSADKFASVKPPDNTAAGRDIGKGDITPGGGALPKEEAIKKFKALGFGNVKNLTLDANGVWRGTGYANGKDVPVAMDAQGDVVAK